MVRYVVLQAPDGEGRPIGLAFELPGGVLVDAFDEYGLPKKITEPYQVRQRDLSEIVYAPGEPGYFEQVLVELARVVAIGPKRTIDSLDPVVLDRLFHTEVWMAGLARMRGSYTGDGQGRRSPYRTRARPPVPSQGEARRRLVA